MHLTASELVGFLDRIGLVAFALGGVEVGVRRRLDVFGLVVMGVVTATGGGLMRDVIVGRLPMVIDRWDYILWPIAGSLLAIGLVAVRRDSPKVLLAVAEAAGLGAFAAAGALVAIQADLPLPAVILLAILTATGGGVIRDLLADRVPMVLRSEVNATAAGVGGLAVWAFDPVSTGGAALLGVAVTALMRVAGLAFDLHLPHPGSDEGKQRRLL
ncbi:MAG: TRIC cation channel family protein [Anaerolineaceae bacterium]